MKLTLSLALSSTRFTCGWEVIRHVGRLETPVKRVSCNYFVKIRTVSLAFTGFADLIFVLLSGLHSHLLSLLTRSRCPLSSSRRY